MAASNCITYHSKSAMEAGLKIDTSGANEFQQKTIDIAIKHFIKRYADKTHRFDEIDPLSHEFSAAFSYFPAALLKQVIDSANSAIPKIATIYRCDPECKEEVEFPLS